MQLTGDLGTPKGGPTGPNGLLDLAAAPRPPARAPPSKEKGGERRHGPPFAPLEPPRDPTEPNHTKEFLRPWFFSQNEKNRRKKSFVWSKTRRIPLCGLIFSWFFRRSGRKKPGEKFLCVSGFEDIFQPPATAKFPKAEISQRACGAFYCPLSSPGLMVLRRLIFDFCWFRCS